MRFKTLKTTALLTLSVLAAIACKKDEETTALPVLDGSVSIIGLEDFMDASSEKTRTLKLKPTGASHPEGGELGYCWKISPLMEKYDTTRYANGLDKSGKPSDGSFEYVLKDSLGTYTVYCYAFAPGYSSSSKIAYTTVVRSGPNGSITGTGVYDGTAGEVESRPYFYVTIGDTDWVNANIYENTNIGTPFRNASAMSGVFGRYYNYEEAKQACLDVGDEWRLPTENDWIKLVRHLVGDNENAPEIKEYSNIYWDKEVNGTPTLAAQLMADGSFNSEKMWPYSPAVGDPANNSGLAFIPTGYANLGLTPAVKSSVYPEAKFEGLFDYAVFWTEDEVEGEEGLAYYRYVMSTLPHLMIGKGNKEAFGASVRCVRTSTIAQ